MPARQIFYLEPLFLFYGVCREPPAPEDYDLVVDKDSKQQDDEAGQLYKAVVGQSLQLLPIDREDQEEHPYCNVSGLVHDRTLGSRPILGDGYTVHVNDQGQSGEAEALKEEPGVRLVVQEDQVRILY